MSLEEEQKSLQTWLETGGVFGEYPEWYVSLKFAAVLNVPPWEIENVLRNRPEWMSRAKAMMDAENKAKANMLRRGRRRR